MKPRRWFVTPELVQWRYMTACGDYAGPFFNFPDDPWGMVPTITNINRETKTVTVSATSKLERLFETCEQQSKVFDLGGERLKQGMPREVRMCREHFTELPCWRCEREGKR
jgi:hypothetical protein